MPTVAVSVTRSVSTKSMSPPSLWISPLSCASFALTASPPVPTETLASKSAVSAVTVNELSAVVPPTAPVNVVVPAIELTSSVLVSSTPSFTAPMNVTSP